MLVHACCEFYRLLSGFRSAIITRLSLHEKEKSLMSLSRKTFSFRIYGHLRQGAVTGAAREINCQHAGQDIATRKIKETPRAPQDAKETPEHTAYRFSKADLHRHCSSLARSQHGY
jgi:hypothetical protein